MDLQTRLGTRKEVKYSLGPYNKVIGDKQKIRLSQGCPNQCPFCYEPAEFELYPEMLGEICKNNVIISDMNLLAKKEALEIIRALGEKKVNDKVVYYELECGIDYRFLTQETADALYQSRFGNFVRKGWVRGMKIAWDWQLTEQLRIRNAIRMLEKAGYTTGQHGNIFCFMIVNWKITFEECVKKLDLLKVWGVKINDCCFDGGYKVAVPEHWTAEQIETFRRTCRRHNIIVM